MASFGVIGLLLGSLFKVVRLQNRSVIKVKDSDFRATKESLSYSFKLKMDFNHFLEYHILALKFSGMYEIYKNNTAAYTSLIRTSYARCDRNICEIDFRNNQLMQSFSYTQASRKLMEICESGLLNQEKFLEVLRRYVSYADEKDAQIARCILYKE